MPQRLEFIDVLAASAMGGRRKSDLSSFERTLKAEITNIHSLTRNINLYRIHILGEPDNTRFAFQPGQFVMLEVPGVGEAPFSIASSPLHRGNLELCIRSVGNLTNFLARAVRGMRVGIRGPFGTGFPVEGMYGGDIILIAGGLGIAALRSPLLYVLEHRSRYGNVDIVYGSRTPEDLLFTYQYDTWRMFDAGLHIIVEQADADDEWRGTTGLITDIIGGLRIGEDRPPENTYAIVCGPPVMFKFVCDMLTRAGMPMQRMFVSLERRMHCGMGKCCRCNVGSTYTCLKGPVFDYWSVMNLKEAI